MKNNEDFLSTYMKDYGITLTDRMIEKFDTYLKLLVEWNQKINLTAITEPKSIKIKHFIDSLLFLSAVTPKKGDKIIDIGTGAGFPGIPIKIARPDLELTLLDSLNKRLVFLDELLKEIDLKAELVHMRAEDGANNDKYREKFDFATSRAVAALPVLCEYCLPYVKVGGCFIALKGPMIEEEIKQSKNAINILGGEIKEIKKFKLTDEIDRSIVIIKKTSKTPTKYPRRRVKISKKPL